MTERFQIEWQTVDDCSLAICADGALLCTITPGCPESLRLLNAKDQPSLYRLEQGERTLGWFASSAQAKAFVEEKIARHKGGDQ